MPSPVNMVNTAFIILFTGLGCSEDVMLQMSEDPGAEVSVSNTVEHVYHNYNYSQLLKPAWRNLLQRYIQYSEPVLRDHCHNRPLVCKDKIFLVDGPKFQCS